MSSKRGRAQSRWGAGGRMVAGHFGVRQGEAVEHALYRELEEEIGLQPQQVTLVGSTSDWIRYRLPK